MVPGRSSKAVVVIVGLWVMACAAALALATTSDQAVAQGCGGGGSPSASGSPSPSESDENPLPTDLPVTFPPVPDQKQAAPEAPRLDPHEEVPVVTAQQDSCKSTITIAYESGKNPKFTGKVGSEEPKCKRARDVTVKKVKKGKDAVVGKAATNRKGRYVVPSKDEARGRFYAQVRKATTENGAGDPITCQAARSRTIRP